MNSEITVLLFTQSSEPSIFLPQSADFRVRMFSSLDYQSDSPMLSFMEVVMERSSLM